MQEIDKRVHLSFFVLFFMNLFYAIISNSYLYLFYFIFALIVAYFVAYPDKFFLLLKDGGHFAKKFVSINKRNNSSVSNLVESNKGITVYSQMENNRDENERPEKERVSKENTESSRKRVSDSHYY